MSETLQRAHITRSASGCESRGYTTDEIGVYRGSETEAESGWFEAGAPAARFIVQPCDAFPGRWVLRRRNDDTPAGVYEDCNFSAIVAHGSHADCVAALSARLRGEDGRIYVSRH